MSSLNLCQGLQSCLEPWIMKPNIQMLKLTPPKSKFSRSISPSSELELQSQSQSQSHSHSEENTTTIIKTNNNNNNNKQDDCDMKTEDTSGWSFLQCLTNTKETADDNKEVYVHPLVKRSSSMLSEKSLEMCTESLGSETGSLVIHNTDDIITTISSSPTTQLIRQTKLRTNRCVSFPPPLTSISGVQVRPLREGGRLVLQAVTVSSSPSTYFHAERCDGRLRLCLVKDFDRSSYEDDDDDGYEDEEEDDEGEDVDGENGKVGGEIGIEKLPRPSRCKEGGRELIWEPFWVAT